MRIGGVSVDLVCDAHYKVDAGALFGIIPREEWLNKREIRVDKRNRIRLAVHCLLVRTADATILVDTGIGNRPDEERKGRFRYSTSKLLGRLRAKEITPRAIDYVILTHTHFISAGGVVRFNARGELLPAFPGARYLVQRASWQEALHPSIRLQDLYRTDDLLVLERAGRVEFLDGDTEVVPGVYVKVTHGYCRGHQVVLVKAGGSTVVYLGALAPTPLHFLNPACVSAYDAFPDDTAACKREFLTLAERHGWILVFPFWGDLPAATVVRRNGHLSLRPYPI
ncbi:MAG: MBL fold metallo-hydrolase [Dehalococcoidia bacterium]|nr:MBL fold metallo-hydrolase [Dehalococcoidia bacterium]MDW8119262.1 MBL fold metallo-hydrolase [Chloroflexota bacterium]